MGNIVFIDISILKTNNLGLITLRKRDFETIHLDIFFFQLAKV